MSIPDYPYSAHPWAIMLWGEKSQWWSEMTWIGAFGVFGVLAILLTEWNGELRYDESASFTQWTVRLILLICFVSLSFHFSALHFQWKGWYDTMILDRGGYLHGIFYLWTFLLGLVCFEEGVFLVSRIVSKISKHISAIPARTKPAKVPESPHVLMSSNKTGGA